MGIENSVLVICAIITACATLCSAYVAILTNTPSAIFSQNKFLVTNPRKTAIRIRKVVCSGDPVLADSPGGGGKFQDNYSREVDLPIEPGGTMEIKAGIRAANEFECKISLKNVSYEWDTFELKKVLFYERNTFDIHVMVKQKPTSSYYWK